MLVSACMYTHACSLKTCGADCQNECGNVQEAYGRIKLCSTMIQDHFIPCYSANMQTAMELYVKYSR